MKQSLFPNMVAVEEQTTTNYQHAALEAHANSIVIGTETKNMSAEYDILKTSIEGYKEALFVSTKLNVKSIDKSTYALIKVSTGAICNRLGYTAEPVISTESTETSMAMEGVGDFLNKIWEAIKRFITYIGEKLKQFYYWLIGKSETATKRIENNIKESKNLNNLKVVEELIKGTEANSTDAINKKIEHTLTGVIETAAKKAPEKESLANQVKETVADFTDETIDKLHKINENMHGHYMYYGKAFNTSVFKDGDVTKTLNETKTILSNVPKCVDLLIDMMDKDAILLEKWRKAIDTGPGEIFKQNTVEDEIRTKNIIAIRKQIQEGIRGNLPFGRGLTLYEDFLSYKYPANLDALIYLKGMTDKNEGLIEKSKETDIGALRVSTNIIKIEKELKENYKAYIKAYEEAEDAIKRYSSRIEKFNKEIDGKISYIMQTIDAIKSVGELKDVSQEQLKAIFMKITTGTSAKFLIDLVGLGAKLLSVMDMVFADALYIQTELDKIVTKSTEVFETK